MFARRESHPDCKSAHGRSSSCKTTPRPRRLTSAAAVLSFCLHPVRPLLTFLCAPDCCVTTTSSSAHQPPGGASAFCASPTAKPSPRAFRRPDRVKQTIAFVAGNLLACDAHLPFLSFLPSPFNPAFTTYASPALPSPTSDLHLQPSNRGGITTPGNGTLIDRSHGTTNGHNRESSTRHIHHGQP